MEHSGAVSARIPGLPGGLVAGSHCGRPLVGLQCRLPRGSGNLSGVSMSSVFRDDGHARYYNEGGNCRGGGKVEKEVKKSAKEKLKVVKGLHKELSRFSQMGFGIEQGKGLVGELQGKWISEAADVLLAELEQLKAEEKEIKKRRKHEKAKLKAERMKCVVDSDSSLPSSSYSSDSSDNETNGFIDTSSLRTESHALKPVDEPQSITRGIVLPILQSTSRLNAAANPSSPGEMGNELLKKIEVCIGGKCRKSGGLALLEELQRAVGVGAAVVGCKCMGKCGGGPNVRICNRA